MDLKGVIPPIFQATDSFMWRGLLRLRREQYWTNGLSLVWRFTTWLVSTASQPIKNFGNMNIECKFNTLITCNNIQVTVAHWLHKFYVRGFYSKNLLPEFFCVFFLSLHDIFFHNVHFVTSILSLLSFGFFLNTFYFLDCTFYFTILNFSGKVK